MKRLLKVLSLSSFSILYLSLMILGLSYSFAIMITGISKAMIFEICLIFEIIFEWSLNTRETWNSFLNILGRVSRSWSIIRLSSVCRILYFSMAVYQTVIRVKRRYWLIGSQTRKSALILTRIWIKVAHIQIAIKSGTLGNAVARVSAASRAAVES